MDRTSYARIRDLEPAAACPCCGQAMPTSDELCVDLGSNTLSAGGLVVTAQPRTAELVAVLLERSPRFVSRRNIITRVWADDAADRTVDAQATRARALLAKLGWTLESKRCSGYRIVKTAALVVATVAPVQKTAPSVVPTLRTIPPALMLHPWAGAYHRGAVARRRAEPGQF